MAVQVSYPGVYIQEVSSGVRTITGVSTSVAMFVGFTAQGPLNKPTLLFSFADYTRAFGSDTSASEMATQVRLFFQNGGERCYVMRIAQNAIPASVTMRNAAAAPVDTLQLTAKNPGTAGHRIRAEVDYATQNPDATFNLTVSIESESTPGVFSQGAIEKYTNLSMDPASGRYAVDVLAQDSDLVVAQDLALAATILGPSYSDQLFATEEALRVFLQSEFDANRTSFRISTDGGATFDDVEITAVRAAMDPTPGTGTLQDALDASDAAAVTVTLEPVGAGAVSTVRITPDAGPAAVVILPAADPSADVTVGLGLGVAQGGIEPLAHADRRPAPTGISLNPGNSADQPLININRLAEVLETTLTELSIDDGTAGAPYAIDLTSIGAASPLYATGPTSYDSYTNVRHTLSQIVTLINDVAAASVDFNWVADREGLSLVLRPVGGQSANFTGTPTLTTNPGGLVAFTQNARYYTVGLGGQPATFQSGSAGNDGTAPSNPSDYQAAYDLIDSDVDLFNLLVLPRAPGVDRTTLWGPASVFCQQRRAFLVMDPPPEWVTVQDILSGSSNTIAELRQGLVKDHAAVYWPRVSTTDDETGLPVKVDPSGSIAGIMSRIDGSRGVWKAAAGIEADVRGVQGLERSISDPENGVINPQAVNAVRVFPNGLTVWGARTMDGFDNSGNDDYKYVPVRRFALFIEESLVRGLKFAVFEPNGETLWAQLRLTVGAFMNNLFRQGAFAGTKSSDSYFVACDSTTTTQNDINLGVVNVVVGFAPLKPAEFVVITLQQKAGEIQV